MSISQRERRERIAAMVLQGLVSRADSLSGSMIFYSGRARTRAQVAVDLADELLARLDEAKQPLDYDPNGMGAEL